MLHKNPINFLLYLIDIMPKYLQKATLLTILKQDGSFAFEYVIQIKLTFLANICTALRKHSNLLFESLIEIAGVHNTFLKNSYELNYLLLSLEYNSRLRLKLIFSEQQLVDSLISVFPSAN